MKWTNPGHQLDDLGARYLKVKNLYLYGTDESAKQAYEFLCWLGVAEEFEISFVVDRAALGRKRQGTFCGKRVIPFQTILCKEVQKSPGTAAVALLWSGQSAERELLEQAHVNNIFYLSHSHNRRDNFIQNFICIWLMYKHGKLLSHWTNYLVTMRCNLNCKHCLNFNEFLESPQDITFENAKEHFDTVFSKFDYLYSLHLCGGEPMLAKELPRIIRYLVENYKDRIFNFFIITNGTVIPSVETLAAVKSLNGGFLIDDYSGSVLRTKVDEIKNTLESHEIWYKVNKAESWFDLDIDNTDNSDMAEQALEYLKDNCNTFLHEFGEKRIYACCYQQYAHRAGIGEIGVDDYIEIADTSKMEILEFRQGYTRKGYVDFCKRCRGIGTNAKLIPAAVQIPRRSLTREISGQRQIQQNTVSVCVPVYNTAKYLARCIKSLLAQTYRDLEIILVDDGSTDGSGLICDEYAALDSRITVIHKNNGGEASARNAGLQAARGEFLMFIDSDDEYLPDAVKQVMGPTKTDGVDLVLGGYLERTGEKERFATGHLRCGTAAEIARSCLSQDGQYGIGYIASTVNAKLFRMEIIRNYSITFNENFVVGNDSVFMCEYLRHIRSVYDIFSPIYIYYKFQLTERVQGMGWYYPDAFFLYAYTADRMIKLAALDEEQSKQLVKQRYENFLCALVEAGANIDYFKDGLAPYLLCFCNEIGLIEVGAKLHLEENTAQDGEELLPAKLLSYLIVNKRYKKIDELIQAFARSRKLLPHKGDYVRQMIHIAGNTDEESGIAPLSDGTTSAQMGTTHDQELTQQVDELLAAMAAEQKRIEKAEQSKDKWCRLYQRVKNWRVTKPLRILVRHVRSIRQEGR